MDGRARRHRNGLFGLARHAPLAVGVLSPGENGLLETQIADHEFAAQQGHETEEYLKLGGLEEIDAGIFHVRHDEPAQTDAVPRRVNRAAHAEGKSHAVHRGLPQLLLHGGGLQMDVESHHGREDDEEDSGERDQAGA